MNSISTSSTAVTSSTGIPPARIAGYDLAKALALLGMVFVNFKYQMQADQYGSPWLLWLSDWFDGRPAVTFVILAGAGMTLLKTCCPNSEHLHPFAKPCSCILRRAIFLFFLGLLFSRIWYADILHFYGVYFIAAIFLVNASNRMIWTLAGVALIFSILLPTYFHFAGLATIDSVWDPQFWTHKGFLEDLFVSGSYPVFPWIVYFILGIWLGRKNLSDDRLQKKILLIAGLCIFSCELIALLVQHILIPDSNFDRMRMLVFFADTSPFSRSLIAIVSASGTALLVIVLCTHLADKVGPSKWLKPLVATAQMSLTLYILHIGIFQLFLQISGLGKMDNCLEFAWLWAAIFCLVAVPFSYYWVDHYGRGPIEKIMRSVSK